MEKFYSKLSYLLAVLLVAGFGQIGISQTEIEIEYSGGGFQNEDAWQFSDVTAGVVEACYATTQVGNITVNVTVTDGNDFEMRAWESFGDTWNGSNLRITNVTAGFDLYNDTPTTSGNGAVSCPATIGAGDLVWSGNIDAISCEITCPADITSGTDAGQCGANVTIPLPSINADCAGAFEFSNFTSGSIDYQFDGLGDLIDTPFDVPVDASLVAVGDVNVTLSGEGDHGAGVEAIEVVDEAGNVILDTPSSGDGDPYSFTVTISAADYNTYAADGNVSFTLLENGTVDAAFGGGNFIIADLEVPTSFVPFVNDYNGGQDASDFYPVGTTVVTYSTTDIFGNPVDCSFSVTVEDTEAPTLDCPGDMTINLDAGECESVFDFVVSASDNCPLDPSDAISGPFGIIGNCTGQGSSLSCGFTATSQVQEIDISGVPGEFRLLAAQFIYDATSWGATQATVNFYLAPAGLTAAGSPLPCVDTDTPIATTGLVDVSTFGASATLVEIPLTAPLIVDATTTGLYMEVRTPAGGVTFNGTVCNGLPADGTSTYLCSPTCGNGYYADFGFALDAFFGIVGEAVSIVEPSPDNDFASGDALPIGENCFEFTVADLAGNVGSCEFCITVNEFANPISALACNDLIQLSLDENCEATVGADLILEGGPYGCYDDYIVELEINGVARPSGLLTGADIGEEIYASVIDPDTGNKCWGRIELEDKQIPNLECTDITVPCSADNTPGSTATRQIQAEFSDLGAIPTSGMASFDMEVDLAGVADVQDINISMVIEHSWVSDLDMELVSPNGTVVALFNSNAVCTQNNFDVTFDDEAGDDNAAFLAQCNGSGNTGACPPTTFTRTGTFQAEGSLADFDGEDVNGTWVLNVTDNVGGDDGAVCSVTLDFLTDVTNPFPLPDGATVVGPAAGGGVLVDGFDGCGLATLTFEDENIDNNCGDDQILRTFTIVDMSGNESSCVQTITLERATVNSLVPPPNYDGLDQPALICDEKCDPAADRPDCFTTPTAPILGWNVLEQGPYAGNPSPYNDMWPCSPSDVRCFGTGLPGGIDCGDINATFEDLRIPICQNGGASEGCYKLLRKWTLLDWCTGEVATYNQNIKIEDTEGPSIKDLDDLTISTEVWACSADFTLPTPWIDDNCSDVAGYTVAAPDAAGLSFNGTDWSLNDAPLGVYDITVTASDCCGNETDTIITITVEDATPPVAVCDQSTVVSLTTTSGIDDDNIGLSKVFASTFDDGSFDNCGPVFFKVIKMDELNGTPNGFTGPFNPGLECIGDDGIAANGDDDLRIFRPGTQVYFDDYVKFCCEDIGETHMVVFRVFDQDPDVFALDASLTTDGTTGAIDPAAMSNPFALGGSFTDCMVEITVQDKVPPYIEAPSDLTVTCEYWFDLDAIEDLSNTQFGTVRDDQNARDSIIIFDRYCGDNTADADDDGSNDPMFPYINNDNFDPGSPLDMYRKSVGIDGYAIDNCGVSVNVNVIPNINCGQGTVTRVFTATDPEGRTSSDIQRITIIDCEPFFINDTNCFNFDQNDGVIWPCDRDLFGCTDDTSPDNTGRPQIFEDQCDQVASTFEDQTFIFEDSACLKIIRKWTVIDWCQFDDNDTDLNDEFDVTDDGQIAGYWQYIQEIKIRNLQAPVFQPCEDITICAFEDNCTAITDQLLIPVTDDCTDFEDLVIDYKIDAFNDGVFDFTGTGNDANNATLFIPGLNGAFPIGTHRIIYSAADLCDNIGTCEFLFTVEDCLEPKAICLNGIATVTIGPDDCIEIWASEFNFQSEDNCTDADDLTFAFSDDPTDTAIEVCCDDPNYDVTVPVDIYVTDEAGNTAICETYMLVTGCDNNSTASVAGAIENEAGEGVEDVMVDLESPAPGIPDFQVTGVDGAFSFNGLPLGYDYTIAPEKDINPLNGVSTFDLVLISKHILGSEYLNSPYKMIAADVNKSGSISAFDIVELRKLILFINTEFQNNTSWRFVPSNFDFATANPFASTFPEVYDIAGLTADEIADFVAIKTGDVNGSANPNALVGSDSRNAVDNLVFSTADQALVADQEVEVSFTAAQLNEVLGYQFTLNLDSDMVEVVDVQGGDIAGMSAANFGSVKEGVITTSWNTERALDVADDAVVFTMTLKALKAGQLSEAVSVSSDFTAAEGYTTDLEFLNIELEFTSENATAGNFALYQNTPNPFKDETVISFNLPEANEAVLTIYDVAGRTLSTVVVDGAKGYNEVPVSRADLSGAGVLYYRLDSGDDSQVKKMIIIE